jgi:hypothetical protein
MGDDRRAMFWAERAAERKICDVPLARDAFASAIRADAYDWLLKVGPHLFRLLSEAGQQALRNQRGLDDAWKWVVRPQG